MTRRAGAHSLLVLGLPVLILTDDDELADHVGRLFEPFVVGHVDPALTLRISRQGATWVVRRAGADAAARVDDVLAHLVRELNGAALEWFSGFAVHAGVVSDGGSAIAFPAASGSGKSTLVAACVRTGFDYVSDEALCIDPVDDRVVRYPKPLSLSAWSCAQLDLPPPVPPAVESQVAVTSLGGAAGSRPLRLRHVVCIDPSDGPLALRSRHRSEAVPALLGMSFNHYKRPFESVELVARLASGSRCWALRPGAPLETAELLAEHLT